MEPRAEESPACLNAVSGPLSGQAWDLEPYSLVRIGRGEATEPEKPDVLRLVIDDKRLSRNHVELKLTKTGWCARDLGSSNGTFVDGERVSEAALRSGMLIQVGATVFELAFSSTGAAGVDRQLATSAQGNARKWAIFAALGAMILIVGAIGGFFLLRGKVGPPVEPSQSPVAVEKAPVPRRTGPLEAPQKQSRPQSGIEPEPVAPAPSDDDEIAALVHASLAAGDYRRAMSQLEGGTKSCKPETIDTLRSKVLKAAEAVLEEEARIALRLAAAKDFDSARATLEDALLRLPEELAQKALESLEKVRTLELARTLAEPERPKRIAASEADEALLEKRFASAVASSRSLGEAKNAASSEWAVLVADLKRLVSDWRLLSSYVARRQKIRETYAIAFARSRPADAIHALFAARTAEWKVGRLRLLYDFTTDDQLKDFQPVSRAQSVLERTKGGLLLRGECRLLHGNPFTRGLVVRAKIPQGGWALEAPNVNVALFTSASSRLTDEARVAPSLLNAFQLSTGPEPNDFAAFLWGYRTVVADYGGEKIEALTPVGSAEAVKMPLQAILFGRSGQLLHQDRRECPWALSARPVSGPLSLEIALEPEGVSWKVNGQPVAQPGLELTARLKAVARGAGSVTLFTRTSQVLFSSLEVEGEIDPAWLEARLEKAAVRELERLERG